jgi:glycosyltransferase involved in cell wall biosynthesis
MKLFYLAAANSVHSHRWIRFFADRGHEVHWLSLAPFDDRPANVKCYDFGAGSKWSAFAKAAAQIRGLVSDIKPDVLHAHYAGTYGVLGALAGFQPFVLTAWGSDVLFVGREKLRGIPVRWALNKAKLITCDAYHMVDAIRDLGVDTSKVKLVFFGVEVDRFSPGAPDSEIIARWGAQGRPVVISLRSLEPVYSIETLLEAVPAVAKQFPQVLFVVCGSGSLSDTLKARAAELGLGQNALFTGRYANVELPRMLRSAQVYVSTSLSDAGIAASTAEAMACGVPVVVSNTGENDKWIEQGNTGFLVPARDPAALAEKISDLLSDQALAARIGPAGREAVVTRNNYVREMEKMEQLYAGLAGRSG